MKKLIGLVIFMSMLTPKLASAEEFLFCSPCSTPPCNPSICQTICESKGLGYQATECNTPRVKAKCGEEACACVCYSS